MTPIIKKLSLLQLFILIYFQVVHSQAFISGYIKDNQNGETLIGASVIDTIEKNGVVSNELGYYRYLIHKDCHFLKVSFVGYEPFVLKISQPKKDSIVDINLQSAAYALNTFTFKASKDNIEKALPGRINIPIERLLSLPSIGGERDILKAIGVLPGVANGAEGTSSLLVRGGNQDQNQFIIDGTTVYNTGHLLGFISTFNPDALKKVDFYKGGFPARFGGRLSSVVDVTFKDGNAKKFSGNFDIGLINSKIAIEGPLKNKKTTYLLAARSTYLDALQALLGGGNKAFQNGKISNFTGYTFFDINAKITHQFNEKNKFNVSYYEGFDLLRNYSFAANTLQKNRIDLNNRALSMRYFSIINSKLSMTLAANYSQNGGGINSNQLMKVNDFGKTSNIFEENIVKRNSFLKDWAGAARFDFSPNEHHFLRFGIELTQHQYQPNRSQKNYNSYKKNTIIRDSTILSLSQNHEKPLLKTLESGIYIEDEISLNENHAFNIGLRASAFKIENTFLKNIEPRFSWRLTLPNLFTINATYARTVQYSHALSVNEIGLERLVWVPSYSNLKPQKSDLISLGLAKSIFDNNFDISIEAFYKKMNHLSQFILYDIDENVYHNWQRNLLDNGIGQAYGLELMANKKIGRFNGFASYTLSKNDRQFEDFNDAKVFPFKYDRRHNINLSIAYQLSEKWKFGALWNYNTGFRQTVANGQLKDNPFFDNDDRSFFLAVNNIKMPDYHRLDISLVNEKKLKSGNIRTFSFNVYNTYARNNPSFLYLKKESTFNNITTPTQVRGVVLTSILPSINWGLKF